MKWFERLLLVAGFATMGYLFWRLDAQKIWANVSSIGLGMAIVLAQQFCDHMLNAWGWLLAFNKKDAAKLSYWRLVMIRIAGDGVNYLTPSATIAGEIVRPAMLEARLPAEAKIASVVVARFTQSIGQALFIMIGLLVVAALGVPRLEEFPLMIFIREWIFVPTIALCLTLTAIGWYALRTWGRRSPQAPRLASLGKWGAVRSEIGGYFTAHPGRFSASVLVFTLSYLWGCVEILIICRLMGVSITPLIALAIEVLSSAIEGIMFMVPAKIGIQEGGKTAIFKGLGLPASQGFALGLIRHIRELAWAAAGFLIYALHKRAKKITPAPEGKGDFQAAPVTEG